MSDLPSSKSTSPTPGADDADGEPPSPALLAAARASRALAARRALDVTPMPMATLPPSLTPAVAAADAMDGGAMSVDNHPWKNHPWKAVSLLVRLDDLVTDTLVSCPALS